MRYQDDGGIATDAREMHAPLNGGSLSISTFSDGTKRLLLCFLGGFPIIGIVSFGVCRSLLSVPERGGFAGPEFTSTDRGADTGEPYPLDGREEGASERVSELTTTMGGAGDALSGCEKRLSGVVAGALADAVLWFGYCPAACPPLRLLLFTGALDVRYGVV